MIKQILPFLLLFVVFSSCNRKVAPVTTLADERDYSPTLTDTSLLWSVTGKGLSEPSYVFGTIHIIPEKDYFLPNHVVKALNSAEEVVFEIDPRDMQDMAAIMGLMTKMNMKKGVTLDDLLSEEDYALVKDYFKKNGMPLFMVKRMKPMFLSTMVGQEGGLGGMAPGENPLDGANLNGSKSYEFELTELAEAAGKEISGLETMDFQLGLFDSIPYEAQAQMLVEAIQATELAEEGDGEDPMAVMIDMYRRQAVAEMSSMIGEDSGMGEYEEILLIKRNRNWIPQIVAGTSDGPRFYAVGAGHLGGREGVIALLRREGYTVEPVYR